MSPISEVTYYRPECSRCTWSSSTVFAHKKRAEDRLARHERTHSRKPRPGVSNVVKFPRTLYGPNSIAWHTGDYKWHLREDCGPLAAHGANSEWQKDATFVEPDRRCGRCWPPEPVIETLPEPAGASWWQDYRRPDFTKRPDGSLGDAPK